MDLGNGVEINFGKLSDVQLQAARTELNEAGEARGLWVPEGAGQIAVVQTIDIEAERARLLGTVEEGANLFNGAISAINEGRKKKDHIPVVAPGEYRERAEDWLTDSRVQASTQLPEAANRSRTIIPRLNRAITHEENVGSWKSAAGGRLYSWAGRMSFLSNWTADQLSGFDPELSDAERLEVIATAYDQAREGSVAKQKADLETLQETHPEIDAAPIFDGSVLARRHLGKDRNWKDSYVRGITLEPAKVDGNDYVPSARVNVDGYAYVRDSYVVSDNAARLRVR